MNIINSPYRFYFGLSFFILFGVIDLIKNPANPKRAKEYGFLFSTALLASLFAIFHDAITVNISREYFEVGKGLGKNFSFFPDVALLAMKASYWVGLIIGIIFLVLNNPKKDRQSLKYSELYGQLLSIALFGIVSAFIGYALSFIFYPTITKGVSVLNNPKAFEHVLFIHSGTYLGALVGTIFSVRKIWKKRQYFNPSQIV